MGFQGRNSYHTAVVIERREILAGGNFGGEFDLDDGIGCPSSREAGCNETRRIRWGDRELGGIARAEDGGPLVDRHLMGDN